MPLDVSENTITLWRRVGSQMRQMWELLDSLHDSAKELRNTNDSLLQHKENELLRLLSLYSIIAIPIWAFIGPFSPLGSELSATVYWIGLGLLAAFLLIVFARARRRKVL
jgi:Mg2+ and Co2+ transporter CorA